MLVRAGRVFISLDRAAARKIDVTYVPGMPVQRPDLVCQHEIVLDYRATVVLETGVSVLYFAVNLKSGLHSTRHTV